MQTAVWPVYSVPSTQFTEALAAAGTALTPPFVGSAIYNLPGLPGGGTGRFFIRAIEYLAVQNVGLEFDFFGSGIGQPTNVIATDRFLSRYQFLSANGVQYSGAGLYRSYVDGLAIPYVDVDTINAVGPRQIHLGIQNVDTVAKSAGAPGAVAITLWVEPAGWSNV